MSVCQRIVRRVLQTKFNQKVIVITGASSGIGLVLARLAAQNGARVALLARRKDRLEKLAQELNQSGFQALAVPCDVTIEAEVHAAFEKVLCDFGRVDYVIANAGFGVGGAFEELSVEDYRRQFETNVFGVIHTVKAGLDALKASQGGLALLGSVCGYVTFPDTSAYSMSKYAVRALSEALEVELLKHSVAVTLVSPGFVASEIRQVDNQGEFRSERKEPVPGWLLVPTEKAALQILWAIARRKREVVISFHARTIMMLQRYVPGGLRWIMKRNKQA